MCPDIRENGQHQGMSHFTQWDVNGEMDVSLESSVLSWKASELGQNGLVFWKCLRTTCFLCPIPGWFSTQNTWVKVPSSELLG